MLGFLGLKIIKVQAMEAIEIILVSMSCPGRRKGSTFLGILIPKRVQHLKEAYLSRRSTVEVRCSVPRRTVLSVSLLTVESAERALMTVSVAIKVGIWLETTHRTEVRLEVLLA